MSRIFCLFAILVHISFITSNFVAGEEWTRFRGPNGSGVSTVKTVPTSWKDSDLNWKIELSGKGHSSPVAWGDRVFVTSANEKSLTRYVSCFRLSDGTKLWSQETKFTTHKKHKNNSFASSTPTVDANHVYVLWHSRKTTSLIAYTHAGEKVWEYDLGPYLHGQGGASSPIVFNGTVVVANDHKQGSALVAVDVATGQPKWKIPREGKRACYGTPCVFHPHGQDPELVFSHCYEGIIGVDPASGKTKWHIDVFGRASQRALGSPVIAGDLVVASSGGVGGERQVVAVRPTNLNGNRNVEEVFRLNKQTPHVPTPLIYKDWMFLWTDGGIVSCVDRLSGKFIWKGRVGGSYYASPICVDGRIYCPSLDGELVVIRAGDKFEELARIELGEPTKSTPAVCGGALIIRTENSLMSVGGK